MQPSSPRVRCRPSPRLASRGVLRSNGVCSTIERTAGPVLSDEYRYKILRLLEVDPQMSQRDIARELGISLGKANYCLQALIERGLVKANNFKNSRNKQAYMYLLTRRGIVEKVHITARFLERKMAEYEALEKEIEQLQTYVRKDRTQADVPIEKREENP